MQLLSQMALGLSSSVRAGYIWDIWILSGIFAVFVSPCIQIREYKHPDTGES